MAQRKSEYDQIREHLIQQTVEITASYGLGQVRTEGSRVIFRCPGCNKDKLTANPAWAAGPITGCWNYNCSIPNTLNAVDFIAHMEGLDPKSQYKMVLDHGNRITTAPLLDAQERLAHKKRSKEAAKYNHQNLNFNTADSSVGTENDTTHIQKTDEDPALTDSVYRKLITSCDLTPKAWEGLQDRGLTKQTVLDTGIGYISKNKGHAVMRALYEEFGDDLGRVPGFYPVENSTSRYWSNFAGKNLVLFPYHDSKGLIRTVEGRVMFGEEDTARYKYLSLTGSGSHLYVYPGMGFENIEAFCEGVFGAIIASQEGICVASIQGFRRYRASGGQYPLPELQDIDFARRTIAYIPDVDSPPNPEVADAAPEAARWLIERQGGQPLIALIPSGKDLDEYLLMLQSQQRRRGFEKLIELGSYTLENYVERLARHRESQAAARTQAVSVDQDDTEDTKHITTTNAHPDHRGAQQDDQQSDEPTPEAMDTPVDAGKPSVQNSQNAQNGNAPGKARSTDHVDHMDHAKAQKTPTEPGGIQQDQQAREEHREQDEQDNVDEDAANAANEAKILDSIARASKLTGEQFYRADISFPKNPPDPMIALNGRRGQTSEVVTEGATSDNKEPLRQRLTAYLKQGALAITKSTARTAFKLTTIFAGLYIALVFLLGLLVPDGAFEGMWKWLALTIIICALLRLRLRSRTTRFQRGALSPGEKT